MNAKAACSGSLLWISGLVNGLQEIFQGVVLRDAEKIVLMRFPQVKSYLVYVLLYHIAAKSCHHQYGRR